MGTGKNYKVLDQINSEYGFFERIIPLEHPRYVMQYKSARIEDYIRKYLEAFGQ